MAKTSASFMSGVPELAVLRLLARKEMYGYYLISAIKLNSNESIPLAEGVIYPTLHSLESRGFLESQAKKIDGRSRIYYRCTTKGKKRLTELKQEWIRVSGGVNAILGRARWKQIV